VISAVLTPLFLVAGTFFPLSRLPRWAQIAGEFNPLHHCVELVRHAAFGFVGWQDLGRVGVLLLFGTITWRTAIFAMTRKLIN
jgi:lipooligosaccharide transport system permease protein